MAGPNSGKSGRKEILLGKSALIAGLLFSAPTVAALVYAGQRSEAERAVEDWTAETFGPGTAAHAVAQKVGLAQGKGVAVSSAMELRRALEAANDGDVIRLMAGHYPHIVLANIRKAGNVTITSADPAQPAIIAELLIRNCAGLTLRDVKLAVSAGALVEPVARNLEDQTGKPQERRPGPAHKFFFIVTNSERIKLDRLNVHGPVDSPDIAQRLRPLIVRDSRNVTVSNSRFGHMWHGLEMLNLDGFTVLNNEFSNLRTDGVRGGNVSNVEIAGNIFTEFRPAPADHPDGIQLWATRGGGKLRNIRIHDNLIVQGEGGAAQGIFLRDVQNSFAFENVDIHDNLVLGGLYNSIAINSVQGGSIVGNRILAYPEIKRVRIRIDNSTGIEMRGNSAPNYVITRSAVDKSDNKMSGQTRAGEARHVTQWLDEKQERRRADSVLQARLTGAAS